MDEEEGGKGGLTSRLLSAGLDGALVEWDVDARRPGPATDSLGGAVWQLAPEPGACIKPGALGALGALWCWGLALPCWPSQCSCPALSALPASRWPVDHTRHHPAPTTAAGAGARVAAACDDGCARIFLAEAGAPGLTYARTLPRVEGRCLAVAWHPSGEVLATAGTDGCIHLWALASGHEVLRITAGDGSSAAREGCIWSLLVLPDGTVVSGDSSGNVQIWDGRHGTLLAAFSQHQADVLQLAASPDGATVFATGACVGGLAAARVCMA